MTHESVGRPRASSRGMLEDAAFELFFEQGYAATTIEHITQRAGVSRNTFFNYFDAKSDLLWLEVDAALDRLSRELETASAHAPAIQALCDVVVDVAAQVDAGKVPLALTQGDVMGSQSDAIASGLVRFARRAGIFSTFLSRRLGEERDGLVILTAANALAGAVSAAWEAWACDGISRRPLEDYVAEACGLVISGLGKSLLP